MTERIWASDLARTRAGVYAPPRIEAPEMAPTAEVGERLGPWLWHHRRQLWPLGVALLLAGTSTQGHLEDPRYFWVSLVVVPFAAVLGALGLRGGGERRFVLLLAGPAALWTAASWAWGIDEQGVWLSLLLGMVPAMGWWARYQSPRSRVEVVGGSIWPWRWEEWCFRRWARKEMGTIARGWERTARVSGVPGARLRRLVAHIDDGCELHVDLAHGQVPKHIKVDHLLSALRAFPVGILTPDPHRPWEIILQELPEEDEDA